jgi:hypothetical protein
MVGKNQENKRENEHTYMDITFNTISSYGMSYVCVITPIKYNESTSKK